MRGPGVACSSLAVLFMPRIEILMLVIPGYTMPDIMDEVVWAGMNLGCVRIYMRLASVTSSCCMLLHVPWHDAACPGLTGMDVSIMPDILWMKLGCVQVQLRLSLFVRA